MLLDFVFYFFVYLITLKFSLFLSQKRFTRKSNLTQHKRLYHSFSDPHAPPLPIPRRFPCSQCPKRFLSNIDLQRHMNIHLGLKEFQCSLCGKAFVQKGHLTDHWRIHRGAKDFACTICNRAFTLNSHLTRHMKKHKGIDLVTNFKNHYW